ncbi:MAG: phosphoribosylanthranilate isomerase [Rhodospirillales bacterium]|nr:phosphoribosylanthranilate isomerase [Rhodospirillales bacterium]
MTPVKICGLRDSLSVAAAGENGAAFTGFVFYPDSPRYVSPAQAKELCTLIPNEIEIVGLFVNPTDREIQTVLELVPLSMIQLHGEEAPARVAEIKQRFSRRVIKAFRLSDVDDLTPVSDYEKIADWLLFDAGQKKSSRVKPEYGGTGQAFDWNFLRGKTFKIPWMLAGGLNIDNVANALSALSPDAIDISSGVEREKGVKDPDKIREFLAVTTNL